jgi:cellulose synthase/poly-beta-1,6-N-acetylglucosamine synthase-like glycosyltransferase
MTLGLVIFWLSIVALVWVYALYPLLAYAFGRLRPVFLDASSPDSQAPLTVGIAVHNGAAQVAERVSDILEDATTGSTRAMELIVASDGSTDGTADVVRALTATDPRIRLLDLERVGQSAAQGRIFEAATSEIVVLTDVETRFADACLAALAKPLADPRVGCVTGILRWHYDERTHTARDEGLYWRYEQRVRAWESRAGWLTAGTGALLAVRRSVYKPAPAHASLDQMLPLYARERGFLTVVAPSAVGTDRGTASAAAQRASRTRIATQGIEANLRMSVRIKPWRSPGAFVAIWSHKILRWATPILAALAATSGTYLAASGASAAYLAPLAAIGLVAALAFLGWAGRKLNVRVPLTGFALTLVNVNVAFAAAWLNVVLRRRVGAWESR